MTSDNEEAIVGQSDTKLYIDKLRDRGLYIDNLRDRGRLAIDNVQQYKTHSPAAATLCVRCFSRGAAVDFSFPCLSNFVYIISTLSELVIRSWQVVLTITIDVDGR